MNFNAAIFMAATFVGLFATVTHVSAQTWTQIDVPSVTWWTGVASSADGKKLVATAVRGNGIYTSTNSGITWISNNVSGVDESAGWISVASSSDGIRLVAAQSDSLVVIISTNSWTEYPGYIYVSTNSGMTWAQASGPGWWKCVASSADGAKLVAANSYIFTSTNSGTTWTKASAPNASWVAISSSADGNKLAAAVYGGSIYTSTNSGATWTQTIAPNINWAAVAMSADGAKLLACGGGLFYFSTNTGLTWIQANVPPYPWVSVASSYDGSHLFAADGQWGYGVTTPVAGSADSGITWHQNGTLTNGFAYWSLTSIASSANGRQLVAVSKSNGPGAPIFICTLPPMPTPSISTTNFWKQQRSPTNSLLLSWPFWAWVTNLVVQRNSDLTTSDWVTVTNTATLVIDTKAQATNYQVVLPITGSQGFFRLNTP